VNKYFGDGVDGQVKLRNKLPAGDEQNYFQELFFTINFQKILQIFP
jgi:hypothetical protein